MNSFSNCSKGHNRSEIQHDRAAEKGTVDAGLGEYRGENDEANIFPSQQSSQYADEEKTKKLNDNMEYLSERRSLLFDLKLQHVQEGKESFSVNAQAAQPIGSGATNKLDTKQIITDGYNRSEIQCDRATEKGTFDAGLGECQGENDNGNLSASQQSSEDAEEGKESFSVNDKRNSDQDVGAGNDCKTMSDDEMVGLHMESHCDRRLLANNSDNGLAPHQQDNVLQDVLQKLSLNSVTPECEYECGLPDKGVLLLVTGEGSTSVPHDPITVTVEEKLTVSLRKTDCSLEIELCGKLSILLTTDEDRCVQLQVHREVLPGLKFTMHPCIDKDLFLNERIIKVKDPNRIFPLGQTEVIRWTKGDLDKGSLPFEVIWDTSDDDRVIVTYKILWDDFVLKNVTFVIPVFGDSTGFVDKSGGKHEWDGKSTLIWSLTSIQPHLNSEGGIGIQVEYSDDVSKYDSCLRPVSVEFECDSFSCIKVADCSLAYIERRLGTGYYPEIYSMSFVRYSMRGKSVFYKNYMDIIEPELDDDWGGAWPIYEPDNEDENSDQDEDLDEPWS